MVLTGFCKWLVVLALTCSIGAHWMILQSVAWVGMVVSYSHGAPLTEAFSKTFDGQHPCKLCKLVQRGKATDKKQEREKPTKEMEKSMPADRAFWLFPPEISSASPSPAVLAGAEREPPPIPPPERA